MWLPGLPQPLWATAYRAALTRLGRRSRGYRQLCPKRHPLHLLFLSLKGQGRFVPWDPTSSWAPASTLSSLARRLLRLMELGLSSGGARTQLPSDKGTCEGGELPLSAVPWTGQARGPVPAEEHVGCPCADCTRWVSLWSGR